MTKLRAPTIGDCKTGAVIVAANGQCGLLDVIGQEGSGITRRVVAQDDYGAVHRVTGSSLSCYLLVREAEPLHVVDDKTDQMRRAGIEANASSAPHA